MSEHGSHDSVPREWIFFFKVKSFMSLVLSRCLINVILSVLEWRNKWQLKTLN